jgi:heme/copper-type cytochrome/quinol oxidase subunit 1
VVVRGRPQEARRPLHHTAFAFFLAGGIEAAIMRAQLTRPAAQLVSPEAYNQLFTRLGVTMMFLFVQPVLSGFSFSLVPLMIDARELAFPRLCSVIRGCVSPSCR